ncbi:TRAP transporter small permease [Seohaeicola nanhaiensis]|uniref:TRAP transporter small permease protein n=1 Tax=Seohaeicola nanhaiensis TaxID=1387282 RepID=A0ABV9KMM5_9RHOB
MAENTREGAKANPKGPLARVEKAMVAVSGVALGSIMVIVVADVVGRYVFNSPFSWSYDLIGLYLMVAAFFLALPDALTHHDHIAVDLFRDSFPPRFKHAALAIGYSGASLGIGLIGWGGWLRFTEAWANDDRIAAAVAWPTWVAYALVALGSAAMLLRCLHRVLGHLRAALTGHEAPGLLPPSASEGH